MSEAAFRPLAVTGASAFTAVGDDIVQTGTSIRAGISGLRRQDTYETAGPDPEWDEGQPLISAPVRELDPHLDGPARLEALIARAIADLAASAALKRAEVQRGGLLLALPEVDPAVERWDLGRSFAPALARRTGLAWKHVRVSTAGHAAVFELLGEASALLARGEIDVCVLAGVDSYLNVDRLAYLDAAYRIKSPRNLDGFVPGEAAAALLLEAAGGGSEGRDVGRAPRRAAGGVITALGLGREPETVRGDKPSSGAGLTQALRAAVGPEGAPWVLCDLNGESYRAFEWGIAAARLGARLGLVRRLVLPALGMGDVGAATGAILVGAVLEAFRRGHAPADAATLWTSSDGPLRAAVRITRA
jgi:3-oxoacyl-[acyl-carrier-protein] synthase-1